MKKTISICFITLFCFFLQGCAKQPSPEELTNADYGTYPTEYKAVIDRYLMNFMKDPSSKQINYRNSPTQHWSSYFSSVKYGYGVCVDLNGKNSFGGYVGFKKHYFLIKNNSIIQHIYDNGETYSVGREAVNQRCP